MRPYTLDMRGLFDELEELNRLIRSDILDVGSLFDQAVLRR